MTLLGFTNYLLQFFFIRLTKHQETHVTEFKLNSVSVGFGGTHTVSGSPRKQNIVQWYSIQYWILPLTGWTTDFIYIGKGPKFKRITKDKIVMSL